MVPEQAAPIHVGLEQSELCPHGLSERLLKHFSRREKQTTFVAIGALRVKAFICHSIRNNILTTCLNV